MVKKRMAVKTKRIYLSSPHLSGYEEEYIKEAFTTNWVAPLGPNVDAFEKELAEYVGAKGAVALSSGTAGIHLALRYLGVEREDMVFCSTFTFIASVNPVLYQGGNPVFIDSEPTNWNMSPEALRKAFKWAVKNGKLPKAVVVVDLYGQSADMKPILEICREYGVPVVEDAAEALGATYKGKKCGTWGDLGVYSFNGNKIITTSGGGMLVSDNEKALEKARFWATQARDRAVWYQHSEVGFNYRMSNISAGIGRGQLKVIEDRVEARRRVFARYQDLLGDIEGISFMPEAGYGRSSRWLTVMVLDRDKVKVSPLDLIAALESYNIESRPAWKPMHLQPLFKGCSYFTAEEGISVSDELFASGICLPSGSNLTEEEQDRVVEVIRKVMEG
ncbi:MAG: pyridoxal phosphate-dependent aminotransferase EpsN [Clostridia bacterium]|nr:pyridoxal phosphate-dependent aminotransferase EpsN [Clostridia bacterium]